MAEKVGIVGIGLMGSALSGGLLQEGFEVQGFDTDGRRLDEFTERGGTAVDSPAAAAQGVNWMITSLPHGEIVREVALGANGIIEGAEKGLILCDASTTSPEDTEKLGSDLAERGIRFLDTCVSGTSAMAWEKDLIVIAGGEKSDFEACRPYLESFSRAAYHMGPVGSGALTKLIINLVLAGNRLALGEGLTLGTKAGMDVNNLLAVLQDGACHSKTMLDKGPKMVEGNYEPEGRMSTETPRLMIEQGSRFGAPTMVASMWLQLVQAGCEMGLAEQDPVAFHEAQRVLAGL
ncbi:MAG: NAD(P)-dependent oxidoreductase, partial [Nitrospinaceae bacterium]|nr:NAD(P)-dependent oxidoreductase [Nitrospinaceae bacterium]